MYAARAPGNLYPDHPLPPRLLETIKMKPSNPHKIQTLLQEKKIHNVLFFRAGRVGDVLFTTPAIRSFHNQYPHTHLSYVASTYSQNVLQYHPLIENIYAYDQKGFYLTRFLSQKKLIQQLKKQNFELAILFSHKKKYLHLLHKTNIPYLFPQQESDIPIPKTPFHIVEHTLWRLQPLGVAPTSQEMEIHFAEKEKKRIQDFFHQYPFLQNQPFALLHPGCFQIQNHLLSTPSMRRLWPIEYFAQTALDFHQKLGLEIVFSGFGKKEQRILNYLKKKLPFPTALATSLNIVELAALIDQASLFLSVDTGPMHIAAARKTPLIALFGPSPPHLTGPWGSGPKKVIFLQLPCSPCRGKDIACYNNVCMKNITPDIVLQEAKKMLQSLENEKQHIHPPHT
ncbi:MAG: glycosyltransferase family 9 protein [Planctomycetota bacterium]|nr:MAG: glycosyltransferase family 9 protein [Planctomycetota bacterium]